MVGALPTRSFSVDDGLSNHVIREQLLVCKCVRTILCSSTV